MSQELQGQIRTALAFLGGLVVSKGWIDEQTFAGISGVLVAVVAAVWSWKSKKKPLAVRQPMHY